MNHVNVWVRASVVLGCVAVLAAGCTNRQQARMQQQTAQTQQQTTQTQQQTAQTQQQTHHAQQGTNQGTQPFQNNDRRINIADTAASKIVSEVPEVQTANVLVTDRTAYVASMLKNNQTLTQDVENRIAEKVRATDANIQNVYVSVNPDFVGRVNTYIEDVRAGRPVAGFVQGFADLVRRVFPTAR
ncbi:YhcN/YlaJ family sporulation lipoprotein [Paenibacillus ehimensis]|uniref:YhcN/YlaJ family sporulation lipoprotein n=1 Tax=Paenibacillus ehimensis TaxID=79264 RepID=A0ABT8V6M1_9BACL|nr:YhcN/YlaJ family sporulation lipoprotein [Paenibacillus ehimensis]MDO3677095.1 YhcN/YlaJ family sporulation lipoprotein [Paenibacillus ehimensis]MEC0213805.1 YhcN/YlaJ family sporulation lipoprotein [Paenibacillus ehimensis]